MSDLIFQYAHGGQRPTAYNHEVPYQRLNSFIKSKLYLIDYDIDRIQSEIKMWNEPEVAMILGEEDLDRGVELGGAKIHLERLQAERKRWETMAEKLHYCTKCNGVGWWWECVAQDESIRVTCNVCKGTGMSPEAQKNAPPVPAPAKKQGSIVNAANGILQMVTGRKFR